MSSKGGGHRDVEPKKTDCLKFAALAAMIAYSVPGQSAEITILGDDVYAPMAYMDRGQPTGVLVSILLAASSRTKDIYKITLYPWRRAYELALAGDGGIIGISFTSERGAIFDFSKPVVDDNVQIVVRAGEEFPFAKLEDLRGKTIGGVQGASYGEIIDKAISQGLFSMDRDIGQVGRLRKLLAGRLDAAFVGNGIAGFEHILSTDRFLANNRHRLAVLPVPLTSDPLHLAFHKGMRQREAVDRFDAAIAEMRASGEFLRLLRSP